MLSKPHAQPDLQVRSQGLVRPSSAAVHQESSPKKDQCTGYQWLVKKYTDRSKAEEAVDIRTPKKVKPHAPKSTYADNYTASWSQRSTCKKPAAYNAKVIDSARAPPAIPWHNVSSSNMQFLSKVDNMGGGRKLFHKDVSHNSLGVDHSN